MSTPTPSGKARLAVRLTTRVGAAAFVTGLALGGPQGLGVASADTRGADGGPSSSAASPSNAQSASTRRIKAGTVAAPGAGASSPGSAPSAAATTGRQASASASSSAVTGSPLLSGSSSATIRGARPAASAPTASASASVLLPSASATVGNTAPQASQTGGWVPGSILAIFVSNGTLTHPDAGILIGNGYSFNAQSCSNGAQCDGGRGGLLYGNGGNGWNAGNGGSAGLIGNGGRGGDAPFLSIKINGGNGGRGGLFLGNGGDGGAAGFSATGGRGGRGGLFFGAGGRGGIGGSGEYSCTGQTCTVFYTSGAAGRGGAGGLFFGRAGARGSEALPLTSPLYTGYTPVFPVLATPPPPCPQGDCNEIGSSGQGLIYPDDLDPAKPYAKPGTVVPNVTLPAGTQLSRWGNPTGAFIAPAGTLYGQLSLPPSNSVGAFVEYVVANPANLPPNIQVEQSQAAPWFGQPGGGTQYRLIDVSNPSKPKDATVQALLDAGYLAYK